jgi:hypothetical protein
MRQVKRRIGLTPAGITVGVCLLAAFCFERTALAQSSEICPRAICGEISPLIPMQSAEAVHMGLVWKRGSDRPKIMFHSRFPEYTPDDVADPEVVDGAIAAGALLNGDNDFNSALRDVLHPSFRDGSNPTADSFQRLTYGGYLLRQGLSQSVPTRIEANRTMERSLLFDFSHQDAFRNNGRFHTALLGEEDFVLNRAAFQEVGFSKGLNYNIYCNARVTLADGRVYVFGGHDMQSQNGLFKVNIFDPQSETWVPRARPCTRDNWARDPFGLDLFSADPEAEHYPGCDQRDIRSTQPADPSDMKYARWYPTAIPLPNNTILILAGTNQDASVGPDPDRAEKGRAGIPQTDSDFSATRVTQVVPEVYDPVEDRTVALENARKTFPLYPQAEVVQTGPGRDDWMVCTMGGLERINDPVPPGGDRHFGPWTSMTWCLDVLGALRDSNRNTPGENHWRLVDEAEEVRPYCCPTASQIEIDQSGHTVSHKWFMISGRDASGAATATIEVIDFAARTPRWSKAGELIHPSNASKAVLLPDGQVFIANGLFRAEGATFEEREGLRYQMFDPRSGVTTPMTLTTVSRGLHGTATLLPDGTVFVAGENREALVRPDDPSFPLDGFPQGDPDLGVPNGQIFRPPYLFDSNSNPASRPAILRAPDEISFRGHFDIEVSGSVDQISSVVLLRSDHNTHSVTTGDRYVKLAFRHKGSPAGSELRVRAPQLPAQAIPGVYMLFVVNAAGVPSVAKQIRLMPETRGRPFALP